MHISYLRLIDNYLKICYKLLFRNSYDSEVYGEEVEAYYVETISDEEEINKRQLPFETLNYGRKRQLPFETLNFGKLIFLILYIIKIN